MTDQPRRPRPRPRPQPEQPAPAGTDAVEPDAVESAPARTDAVESDAVESAPAGADAVEPAPAGTALVESDAVESVPAGTTAVEPASVASDATGSLAAGSAPTSQPTSHRDRTASPRGGRRAALRAVAVLCALAGVVVYVVAARDNGPTGRGGSSASGAAVGAQLLDPAAATVFVAAATTQVVTVAGYDYRSLDQTLAVGQSITTGHYRNSFRSALTGALGRAARKNHTVVTLQVLQAGIGAVSGTGSQRTAQVLIFGRQTVQGTDISGGERTQTVTLRATMQQSGHRYLIAGLDQDANAGLPPGTADLTAAAEAARAEVTASLTYRRSSFDGDLTRAVGGATGDLRSSIAAAGDRTRQVITRGRYDLVGSVTALAVQAAAGNEVVLLVAASGYRQSGSGTRTLVTDGRYRAIVVRSGPSWLVSALDPVPS